MTSGPRDAESVELEGYESVAGADSIAEGQLVCVTLASGARVCLFRYHGTIGAVDDTCTHAEFSLSEGTLHNDGTIECVWHGARFHCFSGAVCRGPAFDPLPTYEVRVEGDRVLVGRRRG